MWLNYLVTNFVAIPSEPAYYSYNYTFENTENVYMKTRQIYNNENFQDSKVVVTKVSQNAKIYSEQIAYHLTFPQQKAPQKKEPFFNQTPSFSLLKCQRLLVCLPSLYLLT